jgi:hypothetical protein
LDTNLRQTSSPAPPAAASRTPAGAFVLLEGEQAYRISRAHRLEPFLVNLASDTDLWMFIASTGGLTAGRVDADGSLFPYLTSDQLCDAQRHTGPLTLIRIERESGPPILWEPFSAAAAESPGVERSLYKNVSGNRILFEEIHHDLNLAFRYRWAGCDEFGWVRTASLANRGPATARIRILDGLRNILPWGAPLALYQQASNLVDAYKKSEVDPATGLGIFSLTSGISDRPEALEVLRANTVWCCGLEEFRVHLSPEAIDAFRRGRLLPEGNVLNGRRGNYLVSASLDLEPGQVARWHFAADAGRDHIQIAALRRPLLAAEDSVARVDAGLRRADENLRRIVASADGLQLTGSPESWGHHFANVLYNTMRGGVFTENNDAPLTDFVSFLRVRNRAVAERHGAKLLAEGDRLSVMRLREIARQSGEADFARLSHEYLPLYYGRRHGDPSRPWNRFEIRVRDRNGERVLHHEGNWRDIFQNWEALGTAFPRFLPNMVARFVNASTVDGFNPYRITRDGVDWEVPSPQDPWSNIGYWGDHQLVYSLRLLEAMERYDPSAFPALLGAEIFSYADVPYRIKPYAEILRDPRATIAFDTERAAAIDARVERIGTDAKLLAGPDGAVHHVNLLEKLLVPALSKLSNLIPGAGIWMNTQRPEWNDANNALGGGGVSVVTLCHLRRYLAFLGARIAAADDRELPISTEVLTWFDRVAAILETERDAAASGVSDPRRRRRIMDTLGGAFSEYREAVYARGFTGRRMLRSHRVAAWCRLALEWVDGSIAANRRADGLYHTYNQLKISDEDGSVAVTHLPEMLEGQVAVLGSGAIEPAEGLAIIERLMASALYLPEQRSFLLYPERELPGFLERNAIPNEGVTAIPLLRSLLASGEPSLVARDASGVVRFHGDIRGARDVAGILDRLAAQANWSAAVARDRHAVLELFERVFEHQSYLGRSAAMYAYEGIGCIYWHMIAKLLLAVQETLIRADREGAPARVRRDLARMYFEVQSGIGYRKTVAEYGAFPTDPYSHTPASGGAKQPGMTGQVKEEILTRLGELGVSVEAGAVHFQPRLLRDEEFLPAPAEFQWFSADGLRRTMTLPAGSLAFTFCQVPVVYERSEADPWIRVMLNDGSAHDRIGTRLDPDLAAEIFDRRGRIDHIRVGITGA